MAVKKAFGFIRDCVEKYIPSFALAALFILFCYQVFMRYVIRQPQAWTGEVEQSCFLWLVLLGACYAQRMKAHVTFTLLYDKLSIKGKAVVAMLGDIIIAFTAFCNILPSLHYVLGLASRHQATTILKWPKTVVFFPYVVMITILMLYALAEIYKYIMVLCGNEYYIEKMKNEDKSEAEQVIEESLAQENIDLTSIDFSSGRGGSVPASGDGKIDLSKTDNAGKEDK